MLDSAPHSYWRLDETSGDHRRDSVLANEGADNGYYTGGDDRPGPGAAGGVVGDRRPTFNGSAYVSLPATW